MRVARMYSPPKRRTQAERRQTTRTALLAAARALFTERGFAATGREDIAERAGVTRGALYHHFSSKADAFAAEVDELEAELVDRVVAAARRGSDPLDRLRRASQAYISAAAEPEVARILLTEAPVVLGPDECRARNAATCAQLLRPALASGVDVPGDPDVAAALLLGVLDEAATIVATAPNRKAARRRVGATVDAFLERLLG